MCQKVAYIEGPTGHNINCDNSLEGIDSMNKVFEGSSFFICLMS